MTSNVLTCAKTIPSYAAHHFALHHGKGHPVALCTDDSAVFGSSLSNEYAIAMDAFNLSLDDVQSITRQALDMSFLDPSSHTFAQVRTRLEEAIHLQ